jgi:hypothetical protein
LNLLEITPAPTEEEAAAIAAALTAFAAQARARSVRARPSANARWRTSRLESSSLRMTWVQTARAEALDAGL